MSVEPGTQSGVMARFQAGIGQRIGEHADELRGYGERVCAHLEEIADLIREPRIERVVYTLNLDTATTEAAVSDSRTGFMQEVEYIGVIVDGACTVDIYLGTTDESGWRERFVFAGAGRNSRVGIAWYLPDHARGVIAKVSGGAANVRVNVQLKRQPVSLEVR